MSPLSLPVLGGAALVSSPALWGLAEGTTSTDVALTRYLVAVAVCWAVLAFVAMLVGPAPRTEAEQTEGRVSDLAEPAEAAAPL